jgi:hypothetical protein
MHHPIFYPHGDLIGFNELRFHFDSPNFKSIAIPYGLCTLADTETMSHVNPTTANALSPY